MHEWLQHPSRKRNIHTQEKGTTWSWAIPLHGLGGQLLLHLLHGSAIGAHVVFTVVVILVVQQCPCPRPHVIGGQHSSKLRGQDLGVNQLVQTVQVVTV